MTRTISTHGNGSFPTQAATVTLHPTYDLDSDDDTEISDTTSSNDEGTYPSSPGGRRFHEDCDTFNRSPNEVVIHVGIYTREPIKEELLDDPSLLMCEDEHCQRESGRFGVCVFSGRP